MNHDNVTKNSETAQRSRSVSGTNVLLIGFYLSTKLKALANNSLRTAIYKAAHNAQCVSKQLPFDDKNVNGYLTRKIFELLHN